MSGSMHRRCASCSHALHQTAVAEASSVEGGSKELRAEWAVGFGSEVDHYDTVAERNIGDALVPSTTVDRVDLTVASGSMDS